MDSTTEAAAADEARTAQTKAARGSLADRMMAGVEHAHRKAAGQDTTETEQRIRDAYLASRHRPADPFLAAAYDRLVSQGVTPIKAAEVAADSFAEGT